MRVADADDLSGARDLQLDLPRAMFARVRRLEDLAQFFKCFACCFHEEEVD